jgi:hypothetical protein
MKRRALRRRYGRASAVDFYPWEAAVIDALDAMNIEWSDSRTARALWKAGLSPRSAAERIARETL